MLHEDGHVNIHMLWSIHMYMLHAGSTCYTIHVNMLLAVEHANIHMYSETCY